MRGAHQVVVAEDAAGVVIGGGLHHHLIYVRGVRVGGSEHYMASSDVGIHRLSRAARAGRSSTEYCVRRMECFLFRSSEYYGGWWRWMDGWMDAHHIPRRAESGADVVDGVGDSVGDDEGVGQDGLPVLRAKEAG
eukprot:915876-Pyramimonas_sp.AAC.4